MDELAIAAYKKAGSVAQQAREFARTFVQPGMTILEIAEAIEAKIKERGAQPGFPVNTSMDEIAAHKTPLPREETRAQGLLKIDIGAYVDGYIGDTAITLDLTPDNKHKAMIALNQELLDAARAVVTPDIVVRDIGEAVSNRLSALNVNNETNYTIIRGLTGHCLDKETIHASPSIPNHANANDKPLKGKAFAVEPFVTTGSGEIYEGAGGGIYALQAHDIRPRDRDARIILQYIKETYKTRPFCERWLIAAGFKKTRFVLRELTSQQIIHHYPLLIEKTKAPVSQMEHSFLVTDDEALCLTG